MAIDFVRARVNMVENQVRTNDVTDLAVQDAMRAIARERFCTPGRSHLAYAEAPAPYADGFYLAEPRDVSKLLQAIAPKPGEAALAIAAPYAAALLAAIGCRVTARLPEGVDEAVKAALVEAGVALDAGPLTEPGGGGPFDIIICEGAVATVPKAWEAALGAGGRLGVVERRGPGGKAQLVLRGADGLLARRELFDATPHLMPGFAPAPVFGL